MNGRGGAALTFQVFHTPAMLEQTLSALNVKPSGKYIDCTAGEGGHSLAMLTSTIPAPSLLCMDRDADALATAARRTRNFAQSVTFVHGNYADVADAAAANGFQHADGALMDLGLSSLQLDTDARGFSFQRDAALDMRFDASQGITARQLVNECPERELADIIRNFGEEPRARRIASAIVRSRPVNTTAQLASVVAANVGGPRNRRRIHPATKTFQALRIAVNDELDSLRRGIDGAIATLGAGGRLAVISYHSLEDRLVKTAMRRHAASCVCPPEIPECACGHQPDLRIINRKVIKPAASEIRENPRSRSARLRAAERV